MRATKKKAKTARPRWQRRPEQRPGEIADAALRVFAKKGFADATMEEIARAAGVSKGTIYLYYPSKENLLVASIEGSIKHFGADVLGPVDGTTDGELTAERVRDVIAGTLERMMSLAASEDTRPPVRLLLAERPHMPRLAETHSQLAIRAHGKMAGFLRKADRAGAIECKRPAEMARALFGLVMVFVFAEEILGISQGALRSKSNRKALIDFALRGLGLDADEE